MKRKSRSILFLKRELHILKTLISEILFLPSFILLKVITAHSPSGNTPEALLIVNNMSLGDILLSTAFIRSMKASCRYRKVYLMLNDDTAEILDTLMPDITLIRINNTRYKINFLYRLRTLKEINLLAVKDAVNISQERGKVNDELILLSGAQNKYCISSENNYISAFYAKITGKLYTSEIKTDSINEYIKLKEVLKYFALTPFYPLYFLKYSSRAEYDDYITVAPLASDEKRSWSMENFRILAEELSKYSTVLLLGSNTQKEKLNGISDGTRIINTAGKIKLSDLPGIIAKSRLFIGNDSGLTHLALNLNKPHIAVIGGGMFGRFFPYIEHPQFYYLYYRLPCFGCRWNCIYKEKYCLTRLRPDEVIGKAEKYLDLKKR